MLSGADLHHLRQRFERRGVAIEPGQGGLVRVRVCTDLCEGELYLHGAHVTGFKPAGQQHDLLFVAKQSPFERGKAIRGGVPICFPWFNARRDVPDPGQFPAHGFARTREWTLSGVRRGGSANPVVSLILELESDVQTIEAWPYRFRATCTVTFGKTLGISLEVSNTGDKPFHFEEALHTYLAVGDVRQARVRGLEQTPYVQSSTGEPGVGEPDPLTLTQETDRVYQGTTATCRVEDPLLARTLVNEKEGSQTTVLWNPWDTRGPKVQLTGDWDHMLCVETANVGPNAVRLDPLARHAMHLRLGVEPLAAPE